MFDSVPYYQGKYLDYGGYFQLFTVWAFAFVILVLAIVDIVMWKACLKKRMNTMKNIH